MWAFLSNSWLSLLLTAVIAYLLGSINWAIIVTRLFSNKDIRTVGSGNAGATMCCVRRGCCRRFSLPLVTLAKGSWR